MNKRIIVGKLGKPHGINGAIRLYPLTDFPEHLSSLKSVYIDNQLMTITNCYPSNNFFIVKFANINDRNEALKLTDRLLTIDRENAAPLKDGEFYCFDLIGLDVYDKEIFLGNLTEILKTGSNDVYVVDNKDTHRQYLVPALKKIVKEIDIANKKITVDLPEELK